MKITREHFKNIVREVLAEEAEYQQFFKKALEKAGKSITQMSDDEKKSFFNKIDSTWKGRGEKNEDLVGKQHKLDVDKDGDIGADDLADLRAGKKVDEAGVPAIIKGMSPKLLKVGEKITINTNGKKTEYKVVKYNSNGDCVLNPVNESVNESKRIRGIKN